MNVRPGDEVIVPANTFVATAEAVALAGATPVFVDVDADTLLLDPDLVDAAISPRTVAVVAVHLYGQMCDMDRLATLCHRRGVALVEDAAQAHGAKWRDRRAGSFGLFAGFSFYPGKNLGAIGDAGAVVTSDPDLAAKVRALGNHGRNHPGPPPHAVATNSRLDAIQATALSLKLRRLDSWNEIRRARSARYEQSLATIASLRMTTIDPSAEPVHHLFVVRHAERDELRAHLADHDIQTGVHYEVPCHRHPAFDDGQHTPLPVAEVAAAEVLSLPMHPHLSVEDIDRVVAAIDGFSINERGGMAS